MMLCSLDDGLGSVGQIPGSLDGSSMISRTLSAPKTRIPPTIYSFQASSQPQLCVTAIEGKDLSGPPHTPPLPLPSSPVPRAPSSLACAVVAGLVLKHHAWHPQYPQYLQCTWNSFSLARCTPHPPRPACQASVPTSSPTASTCPQPHRIHLPPARAPLERATLNRPNRPSPGDSHLHVVLQCGPSVRRTTQVSFTGLRHTGPSPVP